MYISSSKECEGICQVEKQLNIFISIAKMMFGASISDIKIGGEQTFLVNALFDHWRAVENAPIFLIEAIERPILSSTIQAEFTSLLYQCLSKFRNNINLVSEEMPSHCMLFVEKKLVCRVSRCVANKFRFLKSVMMFFPLFQPRCSQNQQRRSCSADALC